MKKTAKTGLQAPSNRITFAKQLKSSSRTMSITLWPSFVVHGPALIPVSRSRKQHLPSPPPPPLGNRSPPTLFSLWTFWRGHSPFIGHLNYHPIIIIIIIGTGFLSLYSSSLNRRNLYCFRICLIFTFIRLVRGKPRKPQNVIIGPQDIAAYKLQNMIQIMLLLLTDVVSGSWPPE